MNKEEIEMLKNFINLGISESASEGIRKYGYLGEKVFNYINQLETNIDEAIKEIKKRSTPEVAQLYIEILERGKE